MDDSHSISGLLFFSFPLLTVLGTVMCLLLGRNRHFLLLQYATKHQNCRGWFCPAPVSFESFAADLEWDQLSVSKEQVMLGLLEE